MAEADSVGVVAEGDVAIGIRPAFAEKLWKGPSRKRGIFLSVVSCQLLQRERGDSQG